MAERNKPDHEEGSLEDPLGIARQPVASDATEPPAMDEESIRRRRARAGLDGHDERPRPLPGMGDRNVDPDGAAGIDMGYGGEGTDIKPSDR